MLFLASAGKALECYSCDYEDEKKDCKGEGIDPAKLPKINDPDGDSCYMCLKVSFGETEFIGFYIII